MITPLQLFDRESSAYTYVLGDLASGEAVLIDGVDTEAERDLAHLRRLGLRLQWVLETHVHADHVTSAGRLREETGARVAVPAGGGVSGADRELADGDELAFGRAESIRVIATPGHTRASVSYLWWGNLFTGDALLVDGCGRTDFQDGDAGALYDAVTTGLFALPDATRVWPAHDYHGQQVSTIGWERRHNARFTGRTRDEFIALMGGLALPPPKLIDVAVPANRRLGLAPATGSRAGSQSKGIERG